MVKYDGEEEDSNDFKGRASSKKRRMRRQIRVSQREPGCMGPKTNDEWLQRAAFMPKKISYETSMDNKMKKKEMIAEETINLI